MKTRNILFAAALVGVAGFASAATTGNQYDKPDSLLNNDRHENAYDSAMKPDRTMRHDQLQSRADYDKSDRDRDRTNQNWDRTRSKVDQEPAPGMGGY